MKDKIEDLLNNDAFTNRHIGSSSAQKNQMLDYLGFDNLNTSSAFGVFDKYNGSYRFYFQGYMQDLRISRRAVYTGAFTPPTLEFEG